MRINGKKVIALAITIVMLCLQPAQSLSGTHVEAESRQQYVARLKQFDSVKALEKAGYEPVCDQDGNTADLNQGTGKKAVYLGYVKTKNPEEAITDIAVLDMKGDYIFNDYKEILKTQKTEIRAQLNDFKTAVSEFRNNYNRKTKMAEYAYSLLDYYVDGKEGDVYAGQGEYKDSGRKLSDLFTDETLSDKKLEKILLQSNDMMLRNIDTYLALATVSDSGERLLKKASKIKKKNIAYKKVKKKAQVLVEYIPKLQEELAAYTDDPLENVMDQNELQNKLNDYDQDEQPGYLASMTLYLLLNQYSYGSSTLAQLVLEEEPTWRDMAALASCMTDAQVTLAEYIGLGQMLMLSAVNCKQWQKATRDTSYVEHMNRAKEQVCLRLEKEKNLTADRAKKAVSSLSVYEGAERAIYEDGVGLTNAALRKNVSTDDSVAAWENISNVTEGTLLATAGTVLLVGITTSAVLQNVGVGYPAELYRTLVNKVIEWNQGSLQSSYKKMLAMTPVLSVEESSAFLDVLSTYIGLQKYKKYHAKLSKIPMVIMDYTQGKSGRNKTFSKYTAVTTDKSEKKAADMNAQKGLQWNAIYTTKDAKAGNPILADSDTAQNLIVIHGTGKAEKPYENVHAFGEEEAFDMNKHAYKNGTGGNYMHITRASQSAEMLLSNKGNATQSSSKENLMSGKTLAFIIAGIVIAGAVIMTFVLTTGQKKDRKEDADEQDMD